MFGSIVARPVSSSASSKGRGPASVAARRPARSRALRLTSCRGRRGGGGGPPQWPRAHQRHRSWRGRSLGACLGGCAGRDRPRAGSCTDGAVWSRVPGGPVHRIKGVRLRCEQETRTPCPCGDSFLPSRCSTPPGRKSIDRSTPGLARGARASGLDWRRGLPIRWRAASRQRRESDGGVRSRTGCSVPST